MSRRGGVCHQIPTLADWADGRHRIQWMVPRTSEARAYWPGLADRAESMEVRRGTLTETAYLPSGRVQVAYAMHVSVWSAVRSSTSAI